MNDINRVNIYYGKNETLTKEEDDVRRLKDKHKRFLRLQNIKEYDNEKKEA